MPELEASTFFEHAFVTHTRWLWRKWRGRGREWGETRESGRRERTPYTLIYPPYTSKYSILGK